MGGGGLKLSKLRLGILLVGLPCIIFIYACAIDLAKNIFVGLITGTITVVLSLMFVAGFIFLAKAMEEEIMK